jgi:hypothetical protein
MVPSGNLQQTKSAADKSCADMADANYKSSDILEFSYASIKPFSGRRKSNDYRWYEA